MLLCSSDKHCRTFLCSTGIGLATACLVELLGSCNNISKSSSYTMTRNSFKTNIQEIYKTLMGQSDFTLFMFIWSTFFCCCKFHYCGQVIFIVFNFKILKPIHTTIIQQITLQKLEFHYVVAYSVFSKLSKQLCWEKSLKNLLS